MTSQKHQATAEIIKRRVSLYCLHSLQMLVDHHGYQEGFPLRLEYHVISKCVIKCMNNLIIKQDPPEFTIM